MYIHLPILLVVSPYNSCEAQVFSLYPNGTLRWLSEVFGSCTSGTGGLAVDSVHKSLYFYYCDNRLVKLSSEDGSVKDIYDLIPQLDTTVDPVILVGSKFAWRFGYTLNDFVIHTVVL